MKRRSVLRAGVTLASSAVVAGCLQTEQRSVRSPPMVENRPDAVYYPSHVEGMTMVGTGETGDYRVAAMYSFPHRFWEVVGTGTTKHELTGDHAMHLMATVWDPETGLVLPETGLSIELNKGGSLVSEEVIYPMLSQPMGFHYGSNVEGDGDGTYTVDVSVGAIPGDGVRTTGDFQGQFTEPGTVSIDFEFSQQKLQEIDFRTLDNAGERGAVEPMDMEMLPNSAAPAEGALPGDVRGSATSGDAKFVVTLLDDPPAGVDADGPYLAVSARTPYNRSILPAMALSATLESGSETVLDGTLTRTLDPDLSYHYGATLDGAAVESGDTLELTVDTPPQVARHEGYETAFLDMPAMEVQL
jgi:hypothetical protein